MSWEAKVPYTLESFDIEQSQRFAVVSIHELDDLGAHRSIHNISNSMLSICQVIDLKPAIRPYQIPRFQQQETDDLQVKR